MKELIVYLLEVLAGSALLLALYVVLLEKRVPFRWCRAYLLASPALAAVIPLLHIPVWPGPIVQVAIDVPTAEWTGEVLAPTPAMEHSPLFACALLYAFGALLIVGLACWQILRIRRLRHNAEIIRTEYYVLVRTSRKIASFSFFRSIYVWAETPADELRAILAHEASHIAHRHSAERMAMELFKAALWWNPFVWITARRLSEAEEFEADCDVLRSGYDLPEYMNVIFKQLFGYRPEIANGLRDSLTKKRFQMMTTQTRSRYALLRLAATVPAVIGLLCAFGFTTKAAEYRMSDAEATLAAQASEAPAAVAPDETGRKVDFHVFLIDRNNRIFSTDNKASGAIIKVVGGGLGAATDNTGKASLALPENTIVEVSYPNYETISVDVGTKREFMLILRPKGAEQSEPAIFTRDEDGVKQKPLYVIDGIERPQWGDLNASSIESITILKGEEATARYGERGRYGVVLITTDTPAKLGKTRTSESKETPFLVAETMPQFQGDSLMDFRTWAQAQILYPSVALKNNISGRVVAEFVIEKDGSVGAIKIVQSPDRSLSEEVRRILSSSPQWTPGIQNGKIVRVKFLLPIDFKIDKKAKAAAKKAPQLTAEQMPLFEGEDIHAFRSWVQSRIRYPKEAMDARVTGRVVVQFTVEGDGSVSDIKTLQTADRLLSEETCRVVAASSGKWTPGKDEGKVVRIRHTLPVDFAIATDKGIVRDAEPRDNADESVKEIVVTGYETLPKQQ